MLQQFPDSPLCRGRGRPGLREVAGVLASARIGVARFYSPVPNWPQRSRGYQTVVDTFPHYSHMDDVLIGLGDAYEAQAKSYRTLRLPGGGQGAAWKAL